MRALLSTEQPQVPDLVTGNVGKPQDQVHLTGQENEPAPFFSQTVGSAKHPQSGMKSVPVAVAGRGAEIIENQQIWWEMNQDQRAFNRHRLWRLAILPFLIFLLFNSNMVLRALGVGMCFIYAVMLGATVRMMLRTGFASSFSGDLISVEHSPIEFYLRLLAWVLAVLAVFSVFIIFLFNLTWDM